MGGTQPAALNDRGQVVGLAYDAQGGSRAFLLERGVLTPLDGPGAVYTRALDINNRGEITGDYGTRAPAAFSGRSEVHPSELPAGHVQHLAVDVVGPGRAQEEDRSRGLLG